ncbi:hypothetical protein HPP92_004101 [Vanilla planifolia]|uniref:Uncharacterized protein n=1 Tax=Vanilla planifolia TaxID=51239 RepID=A0A835S319_VANPL|nr:hypothetical protein HPP92_004101 [Vanilla planifolia]
MDSLSLDIFIREEREEITRAADEDEISSQNRKKRGRFLDRNITLKGHTTILRSLSSRSLRRVFSRK